MTHMEKPETHETGCSVVIPAFNAEKTLPGCLESLAYQLPVQGGYEVIVADDGSADGTAEAARRFGVRYVRQPNRGPASARNRGARLARGKIILFTDADCVPEADWVREMTRPFGDERVVGVKGVYKTRQKALIARFAQAEFEDRYDLLKTHEAIDMVDTYAAAFRRDVFLEAGGFDERFPEANNEDTDLSYRLAGAGHRLVFNPEACVIHLHPDRLGKYLGVKFRRGYWRMVVYRRHPGKAVKDTYTPAVLKIQTLLMAAALGMAPLAVFSGRLVYLTLILWGIILASAVPFAVKTYKKDPLVGVISPGVIFLRSAVFAIGSMYGFVCGKTLKRDSLKGGQSAETQIGRQK